MILAGGKSSRMGSNKAMLPVRGKPNIERLRDELLRVVPANGLFESSRVSRVIVVANESATYQFLGETVIPDRYPGMGPLAGIQVGLEASPSDWNLVVACDMPFATAAAARFLLGHVIRTGEPNSTVGSATDILPNSTLDAVVPVIHGQLHPLFAVYHKRSAQKIEDMIVTERLRIIFLLEQLQVKQVTEADFPESIDVDRVFFNMNRPADWEQAKFWINQER